jgi:hypothetical protein
LQVDFHDPNIEDLLKNEEEPHEESKKNYAGQGQFYYDV